MSSGKLLFAIILNVLVIPGSGQGLLGRRMRGLAFTVGIVIALVGFIIQLQTVLKAEFESPEVQNAIQDAALGAGDPIAKMMSLAKPLSEDITKKHAGSFATYLYLIASIYLASVVDVVYLFFQIKKHEESQRVQRLKIPQPPV